MSTKIPKKTTAAKVYPAPGYRADKWVKDRPFFAGSGRVEHKDRPDHQNLVFARYKCRGASDFRVESVFSWSKALHYALKRGIQERDVEQALKELGGVNADGQKISKEDAFMAIAEGDKNGTDGLSAFLANAKPVYIFREMSFMFM